MNTLDIISVTIGGLTMLVIIVHLVGMRVKFRHVKKHSLEPWYKHVHSYSPGDPNFWLKSELSSIYRMENERRKKCRWWDKSAYEYPSTIKKVKSQIEAEIRESSKESS